MLCRYITFNLITWSDALFRAPQAPEKIGCGPTLRSFFSPRSALTYMNVILKHPPPPPWVPPLRSEVWPVRPGGGYVDPPPGRRSAAGRRTPPQVPHSAAIPSPGLAVVELIFPNFSSPAARKSVSFAFILWFPLRFPCLVPLGRPACLPFPLSDDIIDRYMTCTVQSLHHRYSL